MRDNPFTLAASRLARFPFWLTSRRPFSTPQKALILKTCCLSQTLFATPLLAALSEAYPATRFDWLTSEWSKPALVNNRRIEKLMVLPPDRNQPFAEPQTEAIIDALRSGGYDTVFIPSRSSVLAYAAWRAGIPQRVGLNAAGRGFAHTLAVRPPKQATHETTVYLNLARAVSIPENVITETRIEFLAADHERTRMTALLLEEVGWQSGQPLVLIHPGGGENPQRNYEDKRWPLERYVLLINRLMRNAMTVLLVGTQAERPLIEAINGMVAGKTHNLAGRISLGELGALSELADLFIGNDSAPMHVAAASGCPTVALFGPTDPGISAPIGRREQIHVLWEPPQKGERFSWNGRLSVDTVHNTCQQLLRDWSNFPQ